MLSWYMMVSAQPLSAQPLSTGQHPLCKIFKHLFALKLFNGQHGVKVRKPRNSLSYAANSILNKVKGNSILHTIDFNNIKNIQEWVLLDSGASSHFLLTEAPVVNKMVAQNPIKTRLSNGSHVQSSHTADLDNLYLTCGARTCYIVPRVVSHSLISVVKLCKAVCKVTFI